MDKKAFLDYVYKFITLSEEQEILLLSKVAHRKYLKNQYMVQQGNICETSNFILKGCTKTFYVSDDAQEHIIAFAIEDWWTADLGSFISQSPADFNIQCIEDTDVVQFTHENLQQLYQQIPQLERLFRKIVERAYVASQKRIVRNFSLTAKERYEIFTKNYKTLEQRVPQYMVASYLGITKEFLSKIKSQLLQNP